MAVVTICTQVYNTAKYLPQCIESVLNQTCSDFEFIVVDNGCTDGSQDILRQYAQRDSRIKLIRFEENEIAPRALLEVYEQGTGTYLANLDSDDWWEPDYLEKMIAFLEENALDLAATGTVCYLEASAENRIMRKLERPITLTRQQFAQLYPQYWTYTSTIWANVMKMDLFRRLQQSFLMQTRYPFGSDTLVMLQYMAECTQIGIDDTALYHYRIHSNAISYHYNIFRFDGNIVCYEAIQNFLKSNHALNQPQREWLKLVHLSSMFATLRVLLEAELSAGEKIAECARIVEHPLTALVLTAHCNEKKQWFDLVWKIIFSALSQGELSNKEMLYEVLQVLSPQCCEAARSGGLGLFAKEAPLRDALQRDDWEQLVCRLMELIVQKRYSKQYDLGQMLGSLISPKTPLEGVTDTRFFREYADICMLILCENYYAALEQMTGLLLEREQLYAMEVFLKLYLSLAALEEQTPAFLFGKLQLAWLYLRQNRREECLALVKELAEMGLENEELENLRQEL